MNWVEFFFGWLVKGQMYVSAFDTIMMGLEIFGTYIICLVIKAKIEDIKKLKRKCDK